MTPLGLIARGLLTALGCVLIAQAPGCGSDAEGIDECREIEEARCEAGQYCASLDIGDVDACKRFYRDQCLHGMASGTKPGAPAVKKCVTAIQAAGSCAKQKLQTLEECAAAGFDVGPALPSTIAPCDVIEKPETIVACEFLFEELEIPDAGPETSPETGPETGDDATGDVATE